MEAKKFYKASMETFSQLSSHFSQVSQSLQADFSKPFEFISLSGERIGQTQRFINELQLDYEGKLAALTQKQKKLFKPKEIPKWKNPAVDRMVPDDQKELLKDKQNIQLILPDEQQELWR